MPKMTYKAKKLTEEVAESEVSQRLNDGWTLVKKAPVRRKAATKKVK